MSSIGSKLRYQIVIEIISYEYKGSSLLGVDEGFQHA